MQCQSCQAELIPGKQFCPECGAKVVETCAQCGEALAGSYRFCPACGAAVLAPQAGEAAAAVDDRLGRLARSIPAELAAKIRASGTTARGERKLVTVMFCDLVGSTAIAERMDPEEYRDLLERYLELAFAEVYRVEGVVNQLAGDGVMALFGAPLAHEDAPYRAVFAALAIRDRLAELNARARGQGGHALDVRMGIHTGPVVVGTVGNDLKMDYTAIGDTTNLTARLQTAAAPGTILVSDATYRLVRGFFEVRPAQRLEVRGKREPVTAHEVIGLSDSTTPMAIAEARGLTPLVGRTQELAQLDACFARVQACFAQTVVLVGDAGSGKSRLIYEFRQRLAEEQVIFFDARCSAMKQAVPYAPWISMLRQYFGLTPAEADADACRKLADALAALDVDDRDAYESLCALLSGSHQRADGPDAPEEDAKRQTYEAVSKVVGLAAARAPVIMVVEDLHWIDDPSREMLEIAVSRLERERVMMLVSHRPDYQPAWRVRAALTQIFLAPLPDGDTSAVVRAVAGGPLPSELERQILRKAEGNPFFTEEITRALVEEGHVLRSDGQVRLARPVDEMRLPGTVEELIAARLDRLRPSAKRVVQVASILGRQFRRDQLAAMLADEDVDVGAELATLENLGLIHRKTILSTDEYRFGESLTQNVAYEGLLLRQRRELHERAGRLLEAEPGEPTPERAALLAHHFSRGDDREKAIDALLQAARQAERVPAFPSAARAYQQAWQLADDALGAGVTTPSLDRLALQAAQGVTRMRTLYGAFDLVDLGHVVAQARALATRLGTTDELVDIIGLYGMTITSGGREKFQEGMDLAAEALALAEQNGLDGSALRMRRALAYGKLFAGRVQESLAELEAIVTETGRQEGPDAASDVHLSGRFMRDRARYHTDDMAATTASAAETYERAVRAANRTIQAGSATTLALAHVVGGRYEDAHEWATRSLEISREVGNLSQIRPAIAVAVLAARERGTPIPSWQLELLERGPAVGMEPMNAHLIVEAFVALGNLHGAEHFAQLAFASSGGDLRQATATVAMANAFFHLGPGRWSVATRCYDEALALAEACRARSIVAAVQLGTGTLAAARGDTRAAQTHVERAHGEYRDLGFHRYVRRAEALLDEIRAARQQSA